MSSIAFSIIIPVYNVEQYLDECVLSVLKQTYKNFELILVNDGSTDSSGTKCDHWKKVDPRVHVVHQENSGLSAARNAGIAHASGDYVAFLDSDDFWSSPELLTSIVTKLGESPADVVVFNYFKLFEQTKKTSPPYFCSHKNYAENLTTFSQICKNDLWTASACNKIIRRDLFLSYPLLFVVGITSEDIDWCARLALAAERFLYVNIVGLCYRQRQGSITKTPSNQKLETLSKNVQRCIDYVLFARSPRAELLKPYVAYQYATLVYNVALTPEPQFKSQMTEIIKKNRTCLSWSRNRKVRLLRWSITLIGFSGTFYLLKFKDNHRNWY